MKPDNKEELLELVAFMVSTRKKPSTRRREPIAFPDPYLQEPLFPKGSPSAERIRHEVHCLVAALDRFSIGTRGDTLKDK